MSLQLMTDAELQVKPEPEDTPMTADGAPYPTAPAGQPVKAEPPTPAPSDPTADPPGASAQQSGAAGSGSAAAPPSNTTGVPHVGSLTPESSAQVAQDRSSGHDEVHTLGKVAAFPHSFCSLVLWTAVSPLCCLLHSPLVPHQKLVHAVLRPAAVPLCSFTFLPQRVVRGNP